MSARIVNRMRPLLTSYLRAPHGWSLMGSLFGQLDGIVQAMADGVRQSLIAVCDDDVLDLHARNSNDRRALIETLAQLRAYLLTRWDRKAEAGTEDGLHVQLTRIGYPRHDLVSELELREAGIVGAFGGKVGYSFVVLRLPNRWVGAGLWNDGSLWNGGQVWGSAMTAEAILELTYTLQKWKPGGTSFRFAILDNDGSTTWDGTGFHGNYQTIPINEPWEFITGSTLVADYNTNFLTP